jgi:hypothetical protein
VLAVLALVGAAGCTASTDGTRRGAPTPNATGATSSPGRAGTTPACPAQYAAPDPKRPHMSLSFTIPADHTDVTGHEVVRFTPDLPVTELVFRLTANSPTPAAPGDRTQTRVVRATADHGGGAFTVSSAGAAAGTQGGLLHIPFASTVAAGTTVTATIDFTLHLGEVVPQAFPRMGRLDGYGYFGSGEPLLAWQRGVGWHTENMVGFPAETATSEAMALDLTVVAPKGDTVIASGDPSAGTATAASRTWHATLPAARDVSVASGPFADLTTKVGAVTLHLGAYTAALRDTLLPQFRRAITALVARYGPFPFPSLSVARLPVGGGGIEYPGSILMLDDSREVAVHETAHQWFYAMVGDSQALHPWLDEAFAQYSEELVDGTAAHPQDLGSPGAVDAPVASYGTDASTYYFRTYNKGSAALEAARTAAGPTRFDAALRCYVAADAWRIVDPADLQAALARLPAAIAVLRRAGALR